MNASATRSIRLIHVSVADLAFDAALEEEAAPRTCAAFVAMLPFRNRIIQARWSGDAGWIPLGDLQIGVETENPLSSPRAGEILLYPGGISETEILVPYGETRFACRAGPLEGNHFLTIVRGRERLPALGHRLLWDGAQDILFEFACDA
jgi:hypothetical protein